MLKTYLVVPLLFAVLFTLTGCSVTHVMRIENREVIGVDTMIGELRDTPVILVGERHDAPAHHKLQLEIIKSLQDGGKPFAIGMEMFEESSQKALDAWTSGKVPEPAFKKVFEWNWRNISWSLYEDILRYARDHRIPIVALNAPRGVVQKVSQQGASSLTSDEMRLLPPGINLQVSAADLDFMKSAYPAHDRDGEAFRRICEAQMLRNKFMARRVADYLELHPGSSVVVLAGGGHVREEGGIPAELGKLRHRIVLPTVPGLNADTVSQRDADYLLQEPYFWLESIF
jgi:uncharacterized iron-regulated protein